MPETAMPDAEGTATRKKGQAKGGQSLAEYALILMLIALVCVAAVTLLGIPIRGFYTGFNGCF